MKHTAEIERPLLSVPVEESHLSLLVTVSATVTNTETNNFTPRPLGLIVLIKAAQHGRSVQSRAGHLIAVKSGSGSEEEEGGEEELERQGKEDS